MTVIWFPRVNLNLAGADASYSKGPWGAIESASQFCATEAERGLNGGTFADSPRGFRAGQILQNCFKSIWVNPSQGEHMAERFSEMENSSVHSKVTLEERLKEYTAR